MNETSASQFPEASSPDVRETSREFAEMFGSVPVRISGPAALMLGGFAAITTGIHVSASAFPSELAKHIRFLIESPQTVILHARRLSDTLWISTGERALLETAEHARGEPDAEFVMRSLKSCLFDANKLRQAAADLGYGKGWRRVCHSINKAPWGPNPEIAYHGECDSIWSEWAQKSLASIDIK